MQSVMDRDIDHILVSEEQLKTRVAELGTQISKDYAGKNLLLVSILKGSVVFMADLMRAVSIPCGIDFMVVSSYGGANGAAGDRQGGRAAFCTGEQDLRCASVRRHGR